MRLGFWMDVLTFHQNVASAVCRSCKCRSECRCVCVLCVCVCVCAVCVCAACAVCVCVCVCVCVLCVQHCNAFSVEENQTQEECWWKCPTKEQAVGHEIVFFK